MPSYVPSDQTLMLLFRALSELSLTFSPTPVSSLLLLLLLVQLKTKKSLSVRETYLSFSSSNWERGRPHCWLFSGRSAQRK